MCRGWLGGLTALIIIAGYVPGRTGSSLLTIVEARRIVNEALPKETKRLPGLTLWLSKEDQAHPPRCLTFDILWSNPGPGSVHVGFWSVDRRSGEVWMPLECRRVTNSALTKLQQEIRKRLGVSNEEWHEALKHNPCCRPDR